MKKYNKVLFSSLLIASNLLAIDNWKIMTSSENTLSLDKIKTSLNKVYNAENGLLKIYDASSQFNFALTSISNDKAYIVNQNTTSTITELSETTTVSVEGECAVELVKGFNIVALPSLTFSDTLNGASIKKIYSTDNGLLKIYDASSQFNFALTESVSGKYYIVSTSSVSTGKCSSSDLETPPEPGTTDLTIDLPPSIPTL